METKVCKNCRYKKEHKRLNDLITNRNTKDEVISKKLE